MSRIMTVGDLMGKLMGVPFDTPILVEEFDHSYRSACVEVTTYRSRGGDDMTEDVWAEDYDASAEGYGPPVKCVVVF
jgi:hypothetical protein